MFKKMLQRSNSQTSTNGFQSFSSEIDSIINSDDKDKMPQSLVRSEDSSMPVSLVRSDKLPECLNRSTNNEAFDNELDVSFEKGGEVDVERKEGSVKHEVREYKSIKRSQSTLLAVANNRNNLGNQSQGDKPQLTGQETEPENDKISVEPDKSEINHRISDKVPKIKPSKPLAKPQKIKSLVKHHSIDLAPKTKLTTQLECSDRLISRKMEICHRAQLIECRELCSLYETVSKLDVEMTYCKDLLTQALKSKDKEKSLRCKENLLALHFKMMTVQFHVRLHKEFLAIKEKSFQDLVSAKSCIKDTTALISCLTSSMDSVRMKAPTLPDFSEIIGEKPSLDNFLDKSFEEDNLLDKNPTFEVDGEFGEFVSETKFDDVSRTIHEEMAEERPSTLEIRKVTILKTECEDNEPDPKPIRPRRIGLKRKGGVKRKGLLGSAEPTRPLGG